MRASSGSSKTSTIDRLPPAKRCIYCNEPTHIGRRLGDDYVIPRIIGGVIELPQATCRECKEKIRWSEQFCLRQLLGPAQYQPGPPIAGGKGPKSLPIEYFTGDHWEMRRVTVPETRSMILPFFAEPGVLRGQVPTHRRLAYDFWERKPHQKLSTRAPRTSERDGRRSSASIFDETRFALWIAKIAHGFTAISRDNFRSLVPLLPDLIRREHSPWPLAYLIGGEDHIADVGPTHSLELFQVDAPIGRLIGVRVRLFGNFGTPTYLAITGALPATYRRMKQLLFVRSEACVVDAVAALRQPNTVPPRSISNNRPSLTWSAP